MKNILFILVLLTPYAQYGNNTTNILDSAIKDNPIISIDKSEILDIRLDSTLNKRTNLNVIEKSNSAKRDTSLIPFNTDSIVLPISDNDFTKVIMVKEKSKFDFLRYLLPILTLFLGILTKELIDLWTEKKRIKKSGKRWVAEIQSLEKPIKNQIDSIESFEAEHSGTSFKPPKIVVYSSLNCEVFKSLDKNELVQYIKYCNSGKKFNEIVKISNNTNGYISVLTYLHETLKIKFKDYLNGMSKHIDSLTQNLQTLLIAFANYGVALEKEIGKDPKSDERYRPILALFNEYIMPKMKTGEYNPFELRDSFFTPLLQILSELRLDERTRKLSETVAACFNDIKGIEMENKYIADSISSIKKQYEAQVTNLNQIIVEIEGKH